MKTNQYEEFFFEGVYKDRIGNFTIKDLDKNKRWFYAWIKVIENTIPLIKGKKILELGCAIGGASAVLRDMGFEIYASDVSRYVIKNSKKLRPDINFSVIDVTKKIKLKGKFDYIIAFEVLEHLEKSNLAIKNINKKLKDGGWLVFSTPPPYKRFIETPTHVNVHGKQYWINLLEKNGFKGKNIIVKEVSFIPLLYRLSKYLNFAVPFNIDIPNLSSTVFYFAKKNV